MSVADDDVPYAVVVVKNGVAQEPWSQACTDPEHAFTFTDAPLSGDYYLVEIRQLDALPASFDELRQGTISALSNPIYTW